MKKFFSWHVITILIVTLLLGLFDAPSSFQQKVLPFLPDSLTESEIHLGLDLQGGSQLDYKIDLRQVTEEDRQGIIDGNLREVERRVNRLGTSEPNIYLSEVAGETHIIVELTKISNIEDEDVVEYLGLEKSVDELTDDEKQTLGLEKAKALIGKTVLLEFKEEKGHLDPQEQEKVEAQASAALKKIRGGSDFDVVGQEESLAYPGKVTYETVEYQFADEMHPQIAETVSALDTDEISKTLLELGGTYIVNERGETQENTSLAIVKLIDTKSEKKYDKEVEASHILVAWDGSSNADEEITRTQEEAYDYAKEAIEKLDGGKDFSQVAKFYSDDPSNKDLGGKLTTPVTGDGTYVYSFEEAALELENTGDFSEIIETEFGYHIIKADKVVNDVKEFQYKYGMLSFSTVPDPWQATGLTGKNFVHADVQLDSFYQPYISIEFDDEGARMFEELTGKNVGKPVAIFIGGSLISAPRVNEKISGGSAQITGDFSQEQATTLASDLNTGAIPAPMILTGEYTIGATLGANALKVSLWAGLIGFLVLFAYMILRYRAAGILASAALMVYASILMFMIKAELGIQYALLAAAIVFMLLIYKTINAKDAGGEKFITFVLSCIIFFFLTFMLKTGVVMTLAGVAGIILSIGMAVDANILIFERVKEELRQGRPYTSAVEEGFRRAWSSIRDSNFSTLITCGILFAFGTSIIRGFAFNLAAGILISMFTAITVTKVLLHAYGKTHYSKNLKTLGVDLDKKVGTNFKFIKNTKKWLTLSGVLIAVSILSVAVFGFRPGIDFTGGTLMEIQFTEEVTKEELHDSMVQIQDKINGELDAETVTLLPTAHAEGEEVVIEPIMAEEEPVVEEEPGTGPIDLKNIQIIPSSENAYIVKTKYLTSENHDTIIDELAATHGAVQELRFTTVGPVVGDTLKANALKALIIAIFVIILYVAFAFRKVPKEVSPWRFGISAIFALAHDVIIVTGVFIILSTIVNVEIDILFITALLTILGYSVNDTIVVFDRLRENLLTAGRDEKLEDIADKALNQTLARSLNTSITSILTILALFIGSYFGGAESIRYFLLALLIGMLVGTYSSIFIATSGLVMWTKRAQKKAEERLKNA
jgi:preprotein translocase SecF subunit